MKKVAVIALAALMLFLAACSQPAPEEKQPSETAAESESSVPEASDFGEFSCKTLAGETVTQDIFADKKVTLVNLWGTWCGPCVAELPGLQALSVKLDGSDAQVVGIVEDTYDPENADGNAEALDMANYIRQEAGLTYPNLIPDKSLEAGIISTVSAFPTTWFVDSSGNILGDPVEGSRSEEDYMAMIEEKLAEVA